MSGGQIHTHSPSQVNHCQGFELGLCIKYYRGQFVLMLSSPRHCGHKSFRERGVKVSVGEHETQPTIPEEGGEELANAWGKRDWSKMCWIRSILQRFFSRFQTNFPYIIKEHLLGSS